MRCKALVIWLLVLSSCSGSKLLNRYPDLSDYRSDTLRLIIDKDSLKALASDYLVQTPSGNWELYVSGDAFELGAKTGLLSQDLYMQQQEIFVNRLFEFVPSRFKQRFVMRFMGWYNRQLENYIPEEYLLEIYALSNFLQDDFDYLGNNYQRTLWMHAAHDLGHALQDLAIVGCSSFAVWDEKSKDGKLLIGRNFDFYLNEEFAQNKMVYFVHPEAGIPYMSVSWPGMVGVLSGMNREGLTVTMNAGKSTVPLSAKTPISIVAREILQHASTLDEAIAIAKSKKVFVSESLLIGSAKDKKAILVEISPKRIDFYEPNESPLICTNHFQSNSYVKDKRNVKHIQESHSAYRYQRLDELLSRKDQLGPEDAVSLLRNREGLHDAPIGLGNDKSLNHLLAHHGIVFQPEDKLVFVSNNPGQMGHFTAYDLDEVFSGDWSEKKSYGIDSLMISADPFIMTDAYRNFRTFKIQTERYLTGLKERNIYSTKEELTAYVQLNPELWLGHYIAGRIFYKQKKYGDALECFRLAQTKVVPTHHAQLDIDKHLKKATKKWKNR